MAEYVTEVGALVLPVLKWKASEGCSLHSCGWRLRLLYRSSLTVDFRSGAGKVEIGGTFFAVDGDLEGDGAAVIHVFRCLEGLPAALDVRLLE